MTWDLKTNCASVSPAKACIRVPRGTDTIWEFVLTDARGESVNITGNQVEFLIKNKGGGITKFSKINLPTEHVDPQNGRTAFTIPNDAFDETTTDILFWFFEVWRIKASGEMMLHISGNFILEPTL
jgi:hypothetical protein